MCWRRRCGWRASSAAIAADGRIRDVRLDRDEPVPAASDLMPPAGGAAAGRLHARRGARRHRTQPSRAQRRDRGQDRHGGTRRRASHAWFVGFAPYGRATKRIAFAVIVENAGYGGAAAAPAAGEIVAAAAALGLIGEERDR